MSCRLLLSGLSVLRLKMFQCCRIGSQCIVCVGSRRIESGVPINCRCVCSVGHASETRQTGVEHVSLTRDILYAPQPPPSGVILVPDVDAAAMRQPRAMDVDLGMHLGPDHPAQGATVNRLNEIVNNIPRASVVNVMSVGLFSMSEHVSISVPCEIRMLCNVYV